MLALISLAGCAIAKPRTDDPLEKVNRKVYAFNDSLDKAIIRPVAVGYRKVTNVPVRESVSDFFSNIHLPITIANDLLQARPGQAAESTGRFLVDLSLGVGGLFDPASKMGLPLKRPTSALPWRAGVFPRVTTWCCRSSGQAPCATCGKYRWTDTSLIH
jgi:Surface lipoprotein